MLQLRTYQLSPDEVKPHAHPAVFFLLLLPLPHAAVLNINFSKSPARGVPRKGTKFYQQILVYHK